MIKNLLLLTTFFTFSLFAGIYQPATTDYELDHKQGHVLDIAKGLPKTGVLKKKGNGYVYLDISNEYITKTFPNLILDGHLRPTDSFGSEEGAHITVVKETENCPGIEAEIGKEFTFEVKDLRYVSNYTGNSLDFHTGDRWMFGVESSELEELRMRYGLSALVDQHDFHISLGFEVPFNRINNFGDHPSPKKPRNPF